MKRWIALLILFVCILAVWAPAGSLRSTTSTNVSAVAGTTIGDAAADTEILVGSGAGTAAWVAMSGDATIANTGAVTVADESHAHTTTTISGVDVSADTNLAVTAPVTLTGDTLSYASLDGTGRGFIAGFRPAMWGSTEASAEFVGSDNQVRGISFFVPVPTAITKLKFRTGAGVALAVCGFALFKDDVDIFNGTGDCSTTNTVTTISDTEVIVQGWVDLLYTSSESTVTAGTITITGSISFVIMNDGATSVGFTCANASTAGVISTCGAKTDLSSFVVPLVFATK